MSFGIPTRDTDFNNIALRSLVTYGHNINILVDQMFECVETAVLLGSRVAAEDRDDLIVQLDIIRSLGHQMLFENDEIQLAVYQLTKGQVYPLTPVTC